MDIGQITVKDILIKRVGEEKAAMVIQEINETYRRGIGSEGIQKQVEDLFKREGLDQGEIKLVMSHVLPTC